MTADQSTPLEERLTPLLVACDKALAEGAAPPDASRADTSPELQGRLEQGLACIQLLRQVLPRRSPPAGVAHAADVPFTRLGRFEIRRELGRGAFGIVFLAYDPLLRRELALKVPRPEALVTSDLRQRFLREARAAGGLEHLHIVPVYEAGEAGPVCYIASAYCPGTTLATWIKERAEPAPVREAASLVVTLAGAVQHAHTRGVVHRDLKPGNILLSCEWPVASDDPSKPIDERRTPAAPSLATCHAPLATLVPKITDFGLAKLLDAAPLDLDAEGQRQTQSGAILGTPNYMAPEQARGKSKEVGPAADIYALGAILYEVLVGRPPFQGETTLDTLEQVRTQEPLPLRRLRPKLPRDLETICLKCLHKEPQRRYADAAALAEDLGCFLTDRPIAARPVGRVERVNRWCRRNPSLSVVGTLAGLAVVAVIIVSVSFGLYQSHATVSLRQERQQTLNASARAHLEQGLSLCNQGEVGEGMLWLARSLELASSAQAVDLQPIIRANLAGWRWQLHALQARLDHQANVGALMFAPDGQSILTGTGDGTAQLWNILTGNPVAPTMHHERPIYAVAVSPDGRFLLTGSSDRTARLWDAATGDPLGYPLPHQGAVRAVAFSADGRTLLTGSSDRTARLWDAASGDPFGSSLEHPATVGAVAFSPDGGTVLTGCDDRMVRLWDTATGKLIRTLRGHEERVRAVAFGPDGRTVLTGSYDQTARLWGAATGKPSHGPLRHQDAVRAVAFSPDGQTVLTGGNDQTARLWDVASGAPLGAPLRHQGVVWSVAFSRDGRRVLTGSVDFFGRKREARVWETALGRSQTGEPLRQNDPVLAVAFSHDGRTLVTGSGDIDRRRGEAQLWEVAARQPLGPPLPHSGPVRAVAFDKSGRTVLTGGQTWSSSAAKAPDAQGEARAWDVATGKPLGLPLRHGDAVRAVAFHPDAQRVFTGSSDGQALLWDTATGELLGQPFRHSTVIGAMVMSADGKMILTGSNDRTARLWDVDTGKPFGPALQHRAAVLAVAMSPDGRTLLTGCKDWTARLWQATTGEPLCAPLQHQEGVPAVAFSPDGKLVLTGSTDGTARLWDAATGKPMGPPLSHRAPVNAVAFSPDGQTVVTGNGDCTVRFWERAASVEGDVKRIVLWIQVITDRELDSNGVVHSLDPETWRQYRQRLQELGGPPFP